LFQYGSNMKVQRLEDAIARRAPRHAPAGTPTRVTLLGPAELPGWEFDLGGHNHDGERVCDIREVTGRVSSVWGALFEIDGVLVVRPDGLRSVLDRIEGHRRDHQAPDVYRPTCVEVLCNDSRLHAFTFVCTAAARQCPSGCPHLAVPDYVQDVVVGAAAVGLPVDYQALLASACQAALVGA
jgi:hypothetical protein